MILKRQKSDVRVLSRQADLQRQRLQDLRRDMGTWKRQAFGRPESLLLAFLAGFAIAPRPATGPEDDSDGETQVQSGGKGRALNVLEASFLAWRIIAKPIAAATEPSPTGASPSVASPGDE